MRSPQTHASAVGFPAEKPAALPWVHSKDGIEAASYPLRVAEKLVTEVVYE